MENLFTYIFVIGFGLTIAVVYFYRKDKKRVLPLSEQIYQDALLTISIVKEKSSARQVILKAFLKKEQIGLKDFMVELIAKDKSKKAISFTSIFKEENRPQILQDKNEYYTAVPYATLKTAISSIEFSFESLRFVAETTEGKKYKSHQMILSGRWGLIKMDSGIYN
jgi:predicted nucleic acid-binding protein